METTNYEILVNKENPIDINYLENCVILSLVEISFTRDNDDIFDSFKIKDEKIFRKRKFVSIKKFFT